MNAFRWRRLGRTLIVQMIFELSANSCNERIEWDHSFRLRWATLMSLSAQVLRAIALPKMRFYKAVPFFMRGKWSSLLQLLDRDIT